MSKLIEKTFNGETYYKGLLKTFYTANDARQWLKKSTVGKTFYYRIVKEAPGKYEVYLTQKEKKRR